MGYERLPGSDSESSSSHDPTDEQIFRPRSQVSVPILTLIGLSSTCLILVLILLILSLLREDRSCTVRDDESTSVRFLQNTSRMRLEHEYDHLWNDWMVEGLGIISTTEKMGDMNNGTVGFSMFHQMHCLASLRKALQDQSNGKDIGNLWTDGHWPHCLDYLFQTLYCLADDTKERSELPAGNISGDGVVRTCRDPSRLIAMTCKEMAIEAQQGTRHSPLPDMCETVDW